MIKQWTWRTTLTPDDVFRRPSEWVLITPAEARMQSQRAPIVVVTRMPTGEQAAWYEEHATFFRGSGPPTARTLRYYQYVGGVPTLAAVHATREAEPEAPPPIEAAAPPIVTPFEEHWIEVQLIDPNGDPVPNEAVRIEDSGGLTVDEGRTGADGLYRVELFDTDTYRIVFPDLDKRDYQRVA